MYKKCVCKTWAPIERDRQRHNGPIKDLPAASPLSLLYYNVTKVIKMGATRQCLHNPHPTPTPTPSSTLQFCFCGPRRPRRAAADPSLSPTWGSLAMSGPEAPEAIPPPLPPAPHFPAIWSASIPLLLVFNPRHINPECSCLEVLVVLNT